MISLNNQMCNQIKKYGCFGSRYWTAYSIQILTIISAIVSFQSDGNLPKHGSIMLFQSFRLIAALLFLAAGIFLGRRDHRLLIILLLLYSITVSFCLFFSASFYDYRLAIISLYFQILSNYLGWGTLLTELFAFYNIQEVEEGQPPPPIGIKRKESKTRKSCLHQFLLGVSQNMMAMSTVGAVVLAITVGILLRSPGLQWTPRQAMYLGYLGELFLRVLKCLVLPLIFSSLVYAIGNIDATLSGKIATRAMTYYFATTFIAIFIGIVLVETIEPGKGMTSPNETAAIAASVAAGNITTPPPTRTTEDTVLDLFRSIFTDNIFQATSSHQQTVLVCNKSQTADQCKITTEIKSGSNILGIVMFATIMGVIISKIEQRTLMVNIFQALNEIMMMMTTVAIKFMPLAVVFLVMPQIVKVKDLSEMFGSIGWYSLVVVLGITVQMLVTLPVIYWFCTHKNPFALFKHMAPALITAFGTSSSTATMPVTFHCLEDRAKLDKRVVRFCIPIGATINMDGTALYEAVAAIYIAQYRNIEMSMVQLIIIALTATAASIGAAGIPQAGLITMIIVLNAVNLPPEDAALIIVVDWLLDRYRTLINVLGDSFGAGIVDHLSRNELDALPSPPPSPSPIAASSLSSSTSPNSSKITPQTLPQSAVQIPKVITSNEIVQYDQSRPIDKLRPTDLSRKIDQSRPTDKHP